jgi:5-methylcytosine-specific restriction protein A
MPAYLLTWNPKNWNWADLPEVVNQLESGVPVDHRWSCGNSRSIAVGSRVFLLRQGVEPKGIVASGWVTQSPFADEHWDENRAAKGDKAFFITFAADALLNPDNKPPLDLRPYASGPLSEIRVDAPASGNSISDAAAIALSEAWADHIGITSIELGKADPELALLEGSKKRIFITHRSRERALREAKIKQAINQSHDGRLRCEVPECGFDFEAVYGSLGVGFAHVHHLKPLAEANAPTITRLEDLAVVCANCHAMVHVGGECRDLITLIPRRV